jgi:two-component system sensor histidine kinase ChiS
VVKALNNKTTLEEESNKVNLVILLAVISTCLVVSLITYWTYKDDRDNFFYRETGRITAVLEDSFTNVSHYLKFVGKSIAENCEKSNLEKIALFLQDKVPDDVIEKEVISITMFDWIQPDRMYVANSVYGVFPKKINIEHRVYLDKTSKFPWKAFHSDPVVGVPSAQKVIPVGMGVINEYGDFYGTIATGIRVDKLQAKLENSVSSDETSFILLDQNFNVIVASKHYYRLNKKKANIEKFLTVIKEKINSNEDAEGFLPKNLNLGKNLDYKYYRKISNYPYYLIVGEVSVLGRNSLIAKLIPVLMAITFMGLCAISVQVLFKIRVINPLIAISKANKFDAFSTNILEVDEIIMKLKNVAKVEEIEELKRSYMDKQESEIDIKVKKRTAALENELGVKTEFLNNVSHEIRTPVQGITAITKGLIDHWSEFDDPKKYKLVKDMFKSSDKLFFLINNLLDISKFSSGKMQFSFERVDIRKIIKLVMDEFRPYIEENKRIRINVNIEKKSNFVCYADFNRVAQVLRNLISNAIKYTREGFIEIKADNFVTIGSEHGEEVNYIRVAIKDTGVGVPEDEVEQIFESFSQSSRTKSLSIGTGLGLSISREIVIGHKGKIWAENNKNEPGVTFIFTLPNLVENKYDEKLKDKNKKIRILLIDDEDTSNTSLSLLLYGLNFEIHAVTSGHSALDYLNKHKLEIDLIMLDLIMPDMHGMEILKAIKSDKSLAGIPVLIQSGIAGNAEISDALKLGAVDHIEKPFDKRALLDKITSIFG